MAAGDVYTQTGGTPPLAWVDPATVIAANGRVLASVTVGGGKIPQWMSASDAIAGGNNVYTVFFDPVISHNRPAWLPLSAPPPSTVAWVLNHQTDSISVFALDGTPLGFFTNASMGTANSIAYIGTEVWVSSTIGPTIARFDSNGNLLGTFRPPYSGSSPAGLVDTGTEAWIIDTSGVIGRLKYDGTSNGSTLSGNNLSGPIGGAVIPVTPTPQLWVANQSSWTASRFTLSGGSAGSSVFISSMHTPFGVAPTDTQAWITNNAVNTISRLDFSGGSAGSALSGNGLDQPYGIAQVGTSMWVACQGFAFGSYHVSRFAFDGTTPDGPLTGNGLSQPVGICVVPLGSSPIW